MKAVILAGGFGTRISEESDLRPKPMVEIGGKPILWHIMKIYSLHGINEFVVCLGYKGYMIKEYFLNYHMHTSDFEVDLRTGEHKILGSKSEDWVVTFVDTGLETQTGGRIKRVQPFINDETFCLTYGDGLANVDLSATIESHQAHKKLATITAVMPPSRFANLDIGEDGEVLNFREKPIDQFGWINGGFFVLEPGIFDYIQDDQTIWEREPLEGLSRDRELHAFRHEGFWKPMDTLRDKRELEELYSSSAPWLTRPKK